MLLLCVRDAGPDLDHGLRDGTGEKGLMAEIVTVTSLRIGIGQIRAVAGNEVLRLPRIGTNGDGWGVCLSSLVCNSMALGCTLGMGGLIMMHGLYKRLF
jgi:hypothetical protein